MILLPSPDNSMNPLDTTFGASLVGVIVDAWIFGLICVLTYQYYVNFPKDNIITKLLVAWTCLLQLLHIIFTSKMIYYYLVTSFGKPENLADEIWEWPLYIGISSMTAFTVQVYYAQRTHLLTKSHFLFGIIVLLATCQLTFGFATMGYAFHLVVVATFPSVTWVVVTWLSFAAACDILISLIQVIYLHRYRVGLPSTNRLVNILTLYIISTGLLTSVSVILQLTTFGALGFNFVVMFLAIPMGSLYGVSFLANLDARRTARLETDDKSMPVNTGTTSKSKYKSRLGLWFKQTKSVKTESTKSNGIESFQSKTTKNSDLDNSV